MVCRIVRAGDVERAAAGLPGVVLVLPGLAAGLAGRRDREGLPLHVAGLRIERHDPVAYALVAAGGADDDVVLERQRRRRQLDFRLIVQVLVPDDLAGLLVGRDDARILAGGRDHQIAPERDAAVAAVSLLAGVHLPQRAAVGAGAHVDLVDRAPTVDHVHETVLDQRRNFERLVRRGTADRHRELELHVLDVRSVDLIERRMPLRAVVVMHHQPVVRLGLEQPLVGHVGRLQRCCCEQRARGRENGRNSCVQRRLPRADLVSVASTPSPFVPAQAGTQSSQTLSARPWVPACAGTNGDRVLAASSSG